MHPCQRDTCESPRPLVALVGHVQLALGRLRLFARSLTRWMQALCAGLLLVGLTPAHGALIDYTVTAVGPQSWQYNYTVTNDDEALIIDEFTIYFDRTLFSNLAIVQAPDGWDPLVIQPDLELPSDGFFDALALAFGIAPGVSLSGFSVAFTFLGTGTPGSQPFDIVDPQTLAVVLSGFTSLAAQAVPEPSTMSLLMLAGLVAGAQRVRRRHVS